MPGQLIARVSLDLTLRREFDYLVPGEFAGEIGPGSRVKVPFGPREILGTVLELVADSPHTNLREIVRVLGTSAPLTPALLKLVKWISGYYCCPQEIALKAALPDSVRQEEEGFRERLVVRRIEGLAAQAKLTKRQQQLLEHLKTSGPMPLQRLLEELGTTTPTLRKLEEMHLLTIAPEISERDPYANETILPTQSLVLNAEQQRALAAVTKVMDSPKDSPRTFLLHGVTGSGKTEVYLQAIDHALAHGKGAVVLVPEISLTPQTVERFKARFSSGERQTLVAVLHSHLSAGERHDEWQKVRKGRARIVIGARSAIFAPVNPLGLVIVDEEHEHSYKQEEAPRYNARDVAVMRGLIEGAAVVLGSATPSLETYQNAKRGKYHLLEMNTRADDKKMPIVRVIDMRAEQRLEKATPILSGILREAILQRIERKEQTILFLNRRGYASSLQCPHCGYVAGCPNCSISLTFHRAAAKLACHICGHTEIAPSVCPEAKCRHPGIRFSGLGTEKVEENLRQRFPQARIARMDSDTLKRKEDYRKVLGDFRTGKTDILLGTQMIAKGLHFPNVTLVGIIHADLSLHQPDFRAGERTFQLLTQVAGRAGRGDVEGEVIVQAFTPFHPSIQYARRHDFLGFYEQEIEFREQLKYPPIGRAALLTIRSRNEERAKLSADHVKKTLDEGLKEVPDLIMAGPAPAPLLKAESYFRHQIMLRTPHMTKLSRELGRCLAKIKLPEDAALTVDIDPVNLC